MIEIAKYFLANIFLISLKIVFFIPIVIHRSMFTKRRKKKPFEPSLAVRLLEKNPFIYECSILIWNFPVWKGIYKKINIIEGEQVLQVGCGTGLLNKVISEKINIDNLDINENYLKYGMKKGRFRSCLLGSIYQVESEKEKYDTVLLARCFHHLKKQKKALDECSRILKKNGKIIIYDPVSDQKESFKTRYINTEYDGMIYEYHVDTYTDYINTILPPNLEVVQIEFDKTFTVTNYNLKHPHTDAYVILRKRKMECK